MLVTFVEAIANHTVTHPQFPSPFLHLIHPLLIVFEPSQEFLLSFFPPLAHLKPVEIPQTLVLRLLFLSKLLRILHSYDTTTCAPRNSYKPFLVWCLSFLGIRA